MLRLCLALILALILATAAGLAQAGPPYQSDDPEPTDYRHYEIYLFAAGSHARDGDDGAAGLDFNYGATRDLQLTAVVPFEYENPDGAGTASGVGNVELAAKYRFVHQDRIGWDLAVFPRVFLSSASSDVGDRHTSVFLPVWVQRDFGNWSTFGGGGCMLSRGEDSVDFCLGGWAVTNQIARNLQVGAEIVHSAADTRDGRSSTAIGAGFRYDVTENYHVLAYIGPTLQNAAETADYSWYASFLLTL